MLESILCQVTEYDSDILDPLIGLAVEIAREGREGRRVGTLFTLGDEEAVLARSRPLILDPLLGVIFLPPLLFLDGWRIPNDGLRRDRAVILELALGLVGVDAISIEIGGDLAPLLATTCFTTCWPRES